MHKKGNELRKRRDETNELYPYWVKEHIKLIKLPSPIVPLTQPSSPAPFPISIEEVNELKTSIDRLKREKEALQQDLYQANYEKNELTFKLKEGTKQVNVAKKEAEEEKRKRKKVAACLAGSTEEIRGRNRLLDIALKEIDDVIKAWEEILKGKSQLKEGFEARILNITTSLQESQTIALNERRLRESAERTLQGLPNNWSELIKEIQGLKESEWRQRQEYQAISARNQRLEDEVRHLQDLASQDLATTQKILEEATKWKADFSNLAGFANNVVRDIPRIQKIPMLQCSWITRLQLFSILSKVVELCYESLRLV
jgi:chromosome segregation ATPase